MCVCVREYICIWERYKRCHLELSEQVGTAANYTKQTLELSGRKLEMEE